MEKETITYIPVVLSDNKELQTNLEKENITDILIIDLKAKYSDLKIADLKDLEGYKKVDEARKEVKRIRVLAEKIVKTETDKVFQLHKLAVADGKKVVARFSEIELHLEAKLLPIDNENERLKQEEITRKKLATAKRISELQAYNYKGDYMVVEFLEDEQFNEKLLTAKTEFEAEQNRIAEEKRLAQIEADKLETQRLENEKERLRLEKIQEEQIIAEQKIRIENEKKESEIKERENKIRLQEEKIASEKHEAEQKVIHEAEIEKAKKEAAELALKQAEEKRIQDAKDEEIRIENARLETIRLESLKPEKEKLHLWVNSILMPILETENMSPTAREVHDEIFNNYKLFNSRANDLINSI